ncbi:MAG: carbamate kinase [Treponema sp.]|nr:carbamate kinase [Treponema sp.]
MKKRIVIALGGNALGDSLEEQKNSAKITASAIVDLVEAGHEIAIVHGNGPQVGMIQTAFETAAKQSSQFSAMPLPVCVALSQGYIGNDLQNSLRTELDKRGLKNPVATIITQVEVDPSDPAFKNPTKPIGIFMTKEEADVLAGKGISVMEDAGRGWRQVVASPKPVNIIEVETVKAMMKTGQIPISVGGGGIPVSMKEGQYQGMSAVIDKDFSAAKLAQLIDADMLIILTAVEKVAINFNKPDQKLLDSLSIAEAEKYIAEDHFAKGSMLPKVQAAISFVQSGSENKPHTALITLLTKAKDGIEGKTGTKIVK